MILSLFLLQAASISGQVRSATGPIAGVQVVARHWEEMTALAVARDIEHGLGGYGGPDLVRAGRWGLEAGACRAEGSERTHSSLQPSASSLDARR